MCFCGFPTDVLCVCSFARPFLQLTVGSLTVMMCACWWAVCLLVSLFVC